MKDIVELLGLSGNTIYWYYNINQEQIWNNEKVFPNISDKTQDQILIQQEQQLLLLSRKNDIVVFRHQPDSEFLNYIQNMGIDIPNIKYISTVEDIVLEQNEVLLPYIITDEIKLNLNKSYSEQIDNVRKLNNKFFSRRLMEKNNIKVTDGYFCNNIGKLDESYQNLLNRGFSQVVVKVAFGSSGKGLYVIENRKQYTMFVRYISKRSEKFNLLIEGWYEVEYSLNSQVIINKDNIHILSITEQNIDSRGMYLGTNFSVNINEQILKLYNNEILKVGHLLRKRGFHGIVGVDSIISKNGEIIPVIEINARFTQVTYLLNIVNKLKKNYEYIISSFIRITANQEINFNQMLEKIKIKINPDNTNNFFIYTFSKSKKEDYHYRVFVLFYGNNENKVKDMVRNFNDLRLT